MRVALGSQSPATCPEQAPNQAPALNHQSPAPLPDPAKLAQYFPQLEIIELLGQGGMGAVYKARQPALDRLVALKILPRQAAGDPGFAERFNREARALAKLNHPNIVAVHDFGQANGLNYLVMEYVDGPNLRQLEQAGKLTARQALQIIPQICEALQFAHDEGVVHRDIKPENVLLDRKGRVKIADFGLAKILGREAKDWRLTGARDVMGTPHYMAPEQVEHPQQVDHRADIYSLGVVFYEMLTGELPLGKFAPPSQKVQIDVRLDEVVLHALEKEPSRRYQMASQVKTDLDTISTGTEATLASKTAERSQSNLSFRPRPEAWKVAFGTLAATAILLLLAWGGLRVVGITHDPASLPASAHSPVPPVVVKTVPESGAAYVDPALTELRVTFSKPMKDGSWSWSTWGEENFPETTGAIHYLPDARTCVLPVKLKPGKVYATWINSEQFQSFQDAEGQPAFPYLLIFETKTNNGSTPPGPPPPSD
jgi:serine/threonine protein kinase